MATSSGAQKLGKLLGQAFADVWSGASPEAEPVRKTCANIFSSILSRADSVTGGESSQRYATLLHEYVKQNPAPGADKSGQASSEAAAARQLAATLLGLMPEDYRSLDRVLAKFQSDQHSRSSQTAPVSSPSPQDDATAADRADLRDIILSGGELAAAWPSRDRLARTILERLKNLGKKFKCAEAAGDIAEWAEQVPLQAASSFAVAEVIQTAFAGLSLTGITKSNQKLGNSVHNQIERNAARSIVGRLDRYLVAENSVYLPTGARVPLDAQVNIDTARKEYSLKVLINARRQMDDSSRASRTQTSRDDLVMFFTDSFSWAPALLRDGRPEVYEIKPIDSLTSAVSQVTSYSFNYLTASVRLRCTFLPDLPLARLDNTLMLPASPEHHTIPLPTITVTDVVTITALSALPPIAAEKLASMVQSFMASAVASPPYLAVPFMVSGLYGVIPYFVLDLQQLAKAVQQVIQTIIEALIAAILAYLAAKKAMEELLEQVATALGALLSVLFVFALMAVIIILAWPVLMAAAEAGAAAAALALAAALIVIVVSNGGTKPSDPDRVDANATPLTMSLGPLVVQGITARQMATFARNLERTFQVFLRQGQLDLDRSSSGTPSV